MIYRALIEGGNLSLANPVDDCIHLFYSASNDDEARSKLRDLFDMVKPNRDKLAYDCGNSFSERELMDMWGNRGEPYTFVHDWLVQTGLVGGIPTYVEDAIVFAVAAERLIINAALEEGRKRNATPEIYANKLRENGGSSCKFCGALMFGSEEFTHMCRDRDSE